MPHANQDPDAASAFTAIVVIAVLIAVIAFAWNVTDLFEGFF